MQETGLALIDPICFWVSIRTVVVLLNLFFLGGINKKERGKMKKLLIIMLAGFGVFLIGCSCETWTKLWGGDPALECADHWQWKEKEAVEPAEKVAAGPCAAAPMVKTAQSFPVRNIMGNVIRLEKMSPRQVSAGESFDYQIKVTNLTNQSLQNVLVTEHIPENVTISSSEPRADKMEAGRVHWMLDTLAANDSRVISINAIAEGTGSFTSCADVSYTSPVCAEIAIVEAQIQLTKTAPAEALICDRIPVEYVVTNTGTGYACDIMIKDQLPEGLMTAEGANDLTFTLDSLGPGESRQFTAMLDSSRTGVFESTAVAVAGVGGRVESDMTKTLVVQPVLAIKQSCPADQLIGRSLTYDITVANNGDGMAKDTIIEVMVPEQTKFESATEGGQFSVTSPGKVTWNIGMLEPDSSISVAVKLHCESAGTITSEAMAKAYCAEAVSASCSTMLAGVPGILLEVVDLADPIELGQDETYVITVTNQGSAEDTNIQLTCMLEPGMEYISSSGPTAADVVENAVIFAPLPSIAPKVVVSWRVTVKAVSSGDMRFKAVMNTDQLERAVEEAEATRFYE